VELLADEKERAEHIMLVDLAATMSACLRLRQRPGKRVDGHRRYSHVMHIVSDVTGIYADKDVFDVLRATFPHGTVSGAQSAGDGI